MLHRALLKNVDPRAQVIIEFYDFPDQKNLLIPIRRTKIGIIIDSSGQGWHLNFVFYSFVTRIDNCV